MAPSLLVANTDSMNSVRLSIRISTRSEGDSAAARCTGEPAGPVVEFPPRGVTEKRRAVLSGCIMACRAKWLVSSGAGPDRAAQWGRLDDQRFTTHWSGCA